MLDIPGASVLDKNQLIGGCVRLPLSIDAARLVAEVASLPEELWGGTDGRVGVHRPAGAIFLRGFAPAQGDLPVEDRPVLARLPYVRQIITRLLGAQPLRCLLARLPAGATIAPHVDRAPYFSKSVRIHVPVVTNPRVLMVAGGLTYRMQAGEAWALNNTSIHAVWNAHAGEARTHLICDFLPTPELVALIAAGERDLGEQRSEVEEHLRSAARAGTMAGG